VKQFLQAHFSIQARVRDYSMNDDATTSSTADILPRGAGVGLR
jgi:hypothetical protein